MTEPVDEPLNDETAADTAPDDPMEGAEDLPDDVRDGDIGADEPDEPVVPD